MRNKQGYIIMLTLLIISMAIVLITAVVRESLSYQRQVRAAQDKSNARLLALSSLELAMSQLSFIPPQEKEESRISKSNHRENQPKSFHRFSNGCLQFYPLLTAGIRLNWRHLLMACREGSVITLLLNKARLILMFL